MSTETCVDIYIGTNCKSIRTKHGYAISIIEFITYSGKKATKRLEYEYGISTDNTMVLHQLMCCLSCLTRSCFIRLHTDNAYVKNALKLKRVQQWKKNGWMNKHNKEIANRELWEKVELFLRMHELEVCEMKVHPWNDYIERKLEGCMNRQKSDQLPNLAAVLLYK